MTFEEETNNDNEEKKSTDWWSITLGAIISLFTAGQITLYLSSLWPYLRVLLDDDASSTMYSIIVASNPLFGAISSPLFGLWANRINSTKLPAMAGIIFMLAGNIIYLLLPYRLAHPYIVMLLARAISGIGTGVISVLRANSVTCSSMKDRSRAVSMNSAAYTIGLTCGPAFQLVFTALSYPGIRVVSDFTLNIYNGPALAGIFINLISLILLFAGYKDTNVNTYTIDKEVKDDHRRFFALPKFDKAAAGLIICTRFVVTYIYTSLESIGTLYMMTMFNWGKETAIFWLSFMYMATWIIEFCLHVLNTVFNVGSNLNQRNLCIIGLSLVTLFHLQTFPWWGLPGQIVIEPNVGAAPNGTEITGCSRDYEWCKTVPPVSPVLFIASYVGCISIALTLTTISNGTLFSIIIGPRNQGTMQGYIVVASNLSRLSGLLIVFVFFLFFQSLGPKDILRPLFVNFGPRPTWLVGISVLASCITGWILLYRRLVPLKLPSERAVGDVYMTKFGKVDRLVIHNTWRAKFTFSAGQITLSLPFASADLTSVLLEKMLFYLLMFRDGIFLVKSSSSPMCSRYLLYN